MDNKSARNKFKLDFPNIKPYFIETFRLNIGVSEGNIDGITEKIYDRERGVCDFLRHVNTMDGEVYNTVIQRYISVCFAQPFEKLILMAKSKEGAQSGTI